MDKEHSAAPPSSPFGPSAHVPAGAPAPPGKGRGPLRRWLGWVGRALGACVLLCVAVLGASLVALRNESVQAWLTEKINASMEASPVSGPDSAGVRARITHLSGPLPFGLSLGLELYDSAGLWMRLPDCGMQWDWRALPSTLRVDLVRVNDAHLLRLPLLPEAPPPAPAPPLTEASLRATLGDALRSIGGLPGWLPQVRLDKLSIANARLPQALLGAQTAAAQDVSPAGSAAPDTEKGKKGSAAGQPSAPLAATPAEPSAAPQNGGQAAAPADARLDASLTLAAGKDGAQANLVVSLAGADNLPLQLAGLSAAGVEARAQLEVAVTRAGNVVGLDTTAELATALRMPAAPAAGDTAQPAPAAETAEKTDSAKESPAKAPSSETPSADNGTLAALLRAGASADLRLAAHLAAPAESGEATEARAALENIRVEAGPLRLAGHAAWDAKEGALWLDGPLDVDIQANLGQKPAPDTGEPAQVAASLPADMAGLLPERAQVHVTVKGPLQAPDTRIALDCPAWNVGGHALVDIALKLESAPLDWGRVLAGLLGQMDAGQPHAGQTKISQPGAESVAELTVRVQASAKLDTHPQSLNLTLFARQDRQDGRLLLLAGLRDLQCQLLGIVGSGQLSAALPMPLLTVGMPRLDGKVDLRVTDWQALSAMLPGARLDGDVALSLELGSQLAQAAVPASPPAAQNPGQTAQTQQEPPLAAWVQQASVRWRVPRLTYKAEKDAAVEVHGLEGEAVLTDVFGKGQLAARLDLAAVRSGDIRLGAKLRAQGSILGPLEANLETSGFATTRCSVRWQPGLVELRRLDLDLPSQKLGLRAAGGTTVRYGANDLSVNGLDVAMKPSGRLRAQAALSAEKLDMRLTLERLALAPWHVLIPSIPKGEVEASVRLSGSPAQPGGDMRVNVRDLVLPGTALKPMNATLTGKLERDTAGGGGLALRLVPDKATVAALGGTECRVEARLPLLFGADGLPRPHMQGPLRAVVRWNGAMAPLWNLLPLADQRLAGRLALSLDVNGTLAAPAPKGFVRMDEARYENLLYGVLLSGINLRLDLEQGHAGAQGLARLNFAADDGQGGTARITGKARLDGSMLDFKAVVDHLRPLRRRDVRVELSAQAAVAGSATAPEVRGTLTVNQGLVLLNNLEVGGSITTLPINDTSPVWANAGAAPPDPAAPAVVKGQKAAPTKGKGAAPASASKESAAQAAPASSSEGLLDLRIVIPGRFSVEGYGLKSEWRADMHVGGTPAAPMISGELDATKGSLAILGKNFKLSRGTVTFGGGAVSNPLLDIMLTSQTPTLTANITIMGTVRKMQLTLSSDPQLPRDEILAQLLFGKSASEMGRLENLRLAAAVAQLAGFGTSGGGDDGVMDKARKALGVDVLRFNSGSSGSSGSSEDSDGLAAGSSIEMGKYLTEDIYVGVEKGAKQGSAAFLMQLELTPRSNLELRTEQQSTKGGLTWKYDY